jgi:hypothetical protein
MILKQNTSLESLDFKKFLKRTQPDPQQAIDERLKSYRVIFGGSGTLLFRRAVKNRIIESCFITYQSKLIL